MVKGKPKLHKQVRYAKVLNEAILLAQEDGKAHGVNEVGAFLLPLLDGKHSKEDLVQALIQEYDVTEDVARKDVEEFLDALHQQHLIEFVE